ncbi:DoxX family membrane protein [Flavobacterium selenitireducens]|uniref:DoxX family membrane protein n=1 Tax=Flavobacterium selenitireducens TaxID=2722704 RepID=UPI00168BD122|nr:DoxX family membrane protein [Flavobacterium selenitireducens]MBD3583747.1 DoxX family membrane protein [Flavobacterium selenitireducens]
MNYASILILIFLAVTFIQSGYDKVSDWKGNVGWLKEHFSKTFLRSTVPLALFTILALELAAGIFCVVGSIQLLTNGERDYGFYGAVFSCITLIFLLFGQRIAKDYDGARTICIYFIPAVMAVYWLG